jgi:hypothetical protein
MGNGISSAFVLKLTHFSMRHKAEIRHTYRGDIKIEGKNRKPRKFCPRGPK